MFSITSVVPWRISSGIIIYFNCLSVCYPIPPPAERSWDVFTGISLYFSLCHLTPNTIRTIFDLYQPKSQQPDLKCIYGPLHPWPCSITASWLLTLQEKWWWTARLRACFLRATRVAEHFSQHATFLSDLPKPGEADIVPLHIIPLPEDMVLLMRSPTVPGRDLYDGTASALWHIFRCGSPLVPPAPSGAGRSLGWQSFPLILAQKPAGSQWCCTSELWDINHYKKDVCGLWQWEITCESAWTTVTTPKCFFLAVEQYYSGVKLSKDHAGFYKCEQIEFVMNKSDLPRVFLWPRQKISLLFQSEMTWQLVNI